MNNSGERKKIRLQKFFSQCGVASRRQTEAMIAAARIAVNGEVVCDYGRRIDPAVDTVTLDGEMVKHEGYGYVLLHKPKQVITTRSDTHGRKTVMELLPEKYQSFFPVGRLDYDTTGLLLLTNDGDFADTLLHPRYQIPRVYHATVVGQVQKATMAKIEKGFYLEDGFVSAKVSRLKSEQSHESRLELELTIGRKRIVRRMMAALDHKVLALKRISHGPFALKKLPYGSYRVLREEEVVEAKALCSQQHEP